MVLESLAGEREQLRRRLQVPIGVLGVDVAEVGRQQRQPGGDVAAGSSPRRTPTSLTSPPSSAYACTTADGTSEALSRDIGHNNNQGRRALRLARPGGTRKQRPFAPVMRTLNAYAGKCSSGRPIAVAQPAELGSERGAVGAVSLDRVVVSSDA
jgi:hypothetical protein